MLKKDFVRLNVSIPLELKNKLISYADSLGLNITSALILILNNLEENN